MVKSKRLTGGSRTALRRKVIRHWWVTLGQRRCAYCCCQMHFTHQHKQQASVEHIIPLSKGGSRLDAKNTLLVCTTCNSNRGDKPFDSFVKGLPRESWLLNKYKEAIK